MSKLILPDNPLFHQTLACCKPPGWQQVAAKGNDWHAFVADANSGILRPVTYEDMIEYVAGGEYEERLSAIGENDDLDEDGFEVIEEDCFNVVSR